MSKDFHKIATTLNENLLLSSTCFVKVGKGARKYREIYLSNLYVYVLSEGKIRQKILIKDIKKVISSIYSSEMVLLSESKAILIDSAEIRATIKLAILVEESGVKQINVKDTLLDEYLKKDKNIQNELETGVNINLIDLKKNFHINDSAADRTKLFKDCYLLEQLIRKDEYYILATAFEKRKQVNQIFKDNGKKKQKDRNKKKQGGKKFTVKIYAKKLIGQNKSLLEHINRERIYLQQILSPFIPLLYKSFHSSRTIYSICDYYKGDPLGEYCKLETLSKIMMKNLLAQIVVAIGQIHQCGLVYNQVNMDGILITEEGYVLLNDLGKCRQTGEKINLSEYKEDYLCPEATKNQQVTFSWDWWSLGQLIYELKEGRSLRSAMQQSKQIQSSKSEQKLLQNLKWHQDIQLLELLKLLIRTNPRDRIGSKNDYHEILNHNYFKDVKKKQLSSRSSTPIKKFFNMTKQKAVYQSDNEEDWSLFNSYLKNYQYSRQIQDLQ